MSWTGRISSLLYSARCSSGSSTESKRKQLGTHYTSRDDIELIVEPVLMRPLRQAWEREKTKAGAYIDWQVLPEGEQEFHQGSTSRITLAVP